MKRQEDAKAVRIVEGVLPFSKDRTVGFKEVCNGISEKMAKTNPAYEKRYVHVSFREEKFRQNSVGSGNHTKNVVKQGKRGMNMQDKLYHLMDWPRIEAVVYSEENHPKGILGPHPVKGGILIQGFFPGAKNAAVRVAGKRKEYPMVMEDEAGFYAVLIPGKTVPEYEFLVDGGVKQDPYRFAGRITAEDEARFCAGIHYSVYEKLGAHPMTVDGVEGTQFAVWAPGAIRVSVVGDFNSWDGRVNPMEFHERSGIYELFVPEVKPGDLYKYELKRKGGTVCLRQDPYGYGFEVRPCNGSIVSDVTRYLWKDASFRAKRKEKADTSKEAVTICEINLDSFSRNADGTTADYSRMAPKIADYAKNMGFSYVELLPIMEYPDDQSLGYQTTGYYAPTSRYGTPEAFMSFVDTLHQAGVGVIMDWTPAHFSAQEEGMAHFDGTCLFEHLNPKQGIHPIWGTCVYNYGRPQVKNFLIANALFWSKIYHIDGIRMDGISSILRLDYGRAEGQWVPNIYGSGENLEGIEFLKHLNSVYKREFPENILIVEEETDWAQTTGEVSDSCLGFDYKWNVHFTDDLVRYLSLPLDSACRKARQNDLTLSVWYNYMDRFVLSLSRGESVYRAGRLLEQMPGNDREKRAGLRVGYGFMMTHPGKKLINSEEVFDDTYFRELLKLYNTQPALYEMDYLADGFEWINNMESERNIISYLRKTDDLQKTLLVVCNFSNVSYTGYRVGVPYSGKYKEIFNSDAAAYGGDGAVNPRVKMSSKVECDERENSITIQVPALGMCVFRYSRTVEKVVDNPTARKKVKAVPKKRNLKEELEKKVNEKLVPQK